MRHISMAIFVGVLGASSLLAAQPKANTARANTTQKLTLPNTQQAKQAIVALMGMEDGQAMMTVKLGTCIAAVEAEHLGQVACTVLVKLGAGSTETQADFYRDGTKWMAQPSVSQDKLPFPDPAL